MLIQKPGLSLECNKDGLLVPILTNPARDVSHKVPAISANHDEFALEQALQLPEESALEFFLTPAHSTCKP